MHCGIAIGVSYGFAGIIVEFANKPRTKAANTRIYVPMDQMQRNTSQSYISQASTTKSKHTHYLHVVDRTSHIGGKQTSRNLRNLSEWPAPGAAGEHSRWLTGAGCLQLQP